MEGKKGFEESREDLIDKSKAIDELMNLDFNSYKDENGDQGEQFDFGPDNADENNNHINSDENNNDDSEKEGLKFVVNGDFIKNFDGKEIDGCLFDIKGVDALEDDDSKNKYKKVFVSTAKKMYYVGGDGHIVGDIGENEVALKAFDIDGKIRFIHAYTENSDNLLSETHENHELCDYEIKLLGGEIPEELKKALFEPENNFGFGFPEEEPEPENNDNESQEEPSEQQENKNLNNEGGLGMSEKKTKLIIGNDIKYFNEGSEPQKWYFEVPVSDKEIDGQPQWTKLYIRATDGAVFNNSDLDEKIVEHPDKKRIQVTEVLGKDPKEFELKDDTDPASFNVGNSSDSANFLLNKIKESEGYKNTGGYLSVFDPEMYSNKTDAVSCNGEPEKDFGGFKGTENRYIICGHKLKAKKMFDSGGAGENLFVTQDPELKVYKIDNNNKISPDGLIGKSREMKNFWQELRKTDFFKLSFDACNMNMDSVFEAKNGYNDELLGIKGVEIPFDAPGFAQQFIFVDLKTWKVYRKPDDTDPGDDIMSNEGKIHPIPQKFSFNKDEATFKLEDNPDGSFALTKKMIHDMGLYGQGVFKFNFINLSPRVSKGSVYYKLEIKGPGSDGEIQRVLVDPKTGGFVWFEDDNPVKQKIDLEKGVLKESEEDSGKLIKDLNNNDDDDLVIKIKDAMYDKGERIKFELGEGDKITNQKLGSGSYEFQAEGYKVKATLFGKTRNLFVITKGEQGTTDRKGCIYDLDNQNGPLEIKKLNFKFGHANDPGTQIYDVPELYSLLKEKNKLESKLIITDTGENFVKDEKTYRKIFVNNKNGANDFLCVDPVTKEVLDHTATKRVKINLDGSVSEINSDLFKDRFFLRNLDDLADFQKNDGTAFKDNELGRLFYSSKTAVFVEKGEENNFDVILQKQSSEYKLKVYNNGAVYQGNSRIKLGLKENDSLDLNTDLLEASSFSLRNPKDLSTEEGKFIAMIRAEIEKVDPEFFSSVTVDFIDGPILCSGTASLTSKQAIRMRIQNDKNEKRVIWIDNKNGGVYEDQDLKIRLKLKKNESSGFIEVEEDKEENFVLTPENDFEGIAKKIEAKYPDFYKDDQEQKITFELEPQKPDKNTPAVKIFVIINGKKDEKAFVYVSNAGKIFKDYTTLEELKVKHGSLDPNLLKNLVGFRTKITKIGCDNSGKLHVDLVGEEQPQMTIEDEFFKANGFNYDDLKDYYKKVTLELDPVHPNKDTTTVKILIKVNGECKSNLRVDKNKKVFQDDNGNIGLGLWKISYTEDGLVIKTLAGDHFSSFIKQITIDDEFFEDNGLDYDALKDFFGEAQENKITFELDPSKPDKDTPFVKMAIKVNDKLKDRICVDKNKKLFFEDHDQSKVGEPVRRINYDAKGDFAFDACLMQAEYSNKQITIDDKFFKDNGLDLNLFKDFFVKENILGFEVYEKSLENKNGSAEFCIKVTAGNETKRHWFLVNTDGNLDYADISPIKPVKEIKFNKDTGELTVDTSGDNRPTVNVRDKFFKDHNLDLGLFKNFLDKSQDQTKEVSLDLDNIKIENGIAKIEVFGGTKYGNIYRCISIDKNGDVSSSSVGHVSGISPDGNYMSGPALNILDEKTDFELETTKMFKGVRKALEAKGFFAKEKILKFGVEPETITESSICARFWIKDNTSVNYFELFPDGSLKDEKEKRDVISIEFDSNTGNIKVDKDSSEGSENKSAFNIKNKFFKDHNLDLSMFGDFLKKDIALDFRPDEVIVVAGVADVNVLVDGKKQDPDISLEFNSNGEVKYKGDLIFGIDKNGKPILAGENNKVLNVLQEKDFDLETNKMFKNAKTALAKLFCNKKDLNYSLSDGPYTSESKFAKIKINFGNQIKNLFVDKDCKVYAKYEDDQFSEPVLDVKLSEDAKEIEIIYYDENDEQQKQLTVNDSRFKDIDSKLTDFLKKETIRKLEFELVKPEKDAERAVMKVKLVDDNGKMIRETKLSVDKKGFLYITNEDPVLEISVRDDDIYLNANKNSKEVETIPLNIITDELFFKNYNLDLSILDEFLEVGKKLNFVIDNGTVENDSKHGKFVKLLVSVNGFGYKQNICVTEQGKIFNYVAKDQGIMSLDAEISEINIVDYHKLSIKTDGAPLNLENKLFDSIRDEIKACFEQKEENKIISFGEPKKTQDGKFVEIEVKLNDKSQNPPVFIYSDKDGKIFSGNDKNELVKEIDKNGKIVKSSSQSEQLDLLKRNDGIYTDLMDKIKLSFVELGLKVGKQKIVRDKVTLETEKNGVEIEIPRNIIKIENKGKELYFDANTMFLTDENGKVKLFKENNNDIPKKLTDEYKDDFKDIKVIKTEDGTQIDLNAPSKLEMIRSANLAYSESKIGGYELQAKIISCFGEKAFNDLSKQIYNYIDDEIKRGRLKKNPSKDEIKNYLEKKINMHPVWKYITSGAFISGAAGLSGLGIGALATSGALIASLGPIGFIAILAGAGVLTVGGATGFFADMYCTNRNKAKTIIIKNNEGKNINVFDKVKSKKQEKPKQDEKSTKSSKEQEI